MAKLRISAVFTLILALVMIVVACAAPPAAQTTTPTPTQQVKKVYKIGISGPLGFDNGKLAVAGAKLAAAEINAAGGFKAGNDTYTIEVVAVDSNEFVSVPDAVKAMEKLMTVEKVNIVIAGSSSEAVMAQQEVMADNKIIMMGHGVSANQLNTRVKDNYERYKYWFRFYPANTDYQFNSIMGSQQVVMETVKEKLGIQKPKVALMIEKALWTEAYAKAFPSITEGMGGEVVGLWQPSPKATDLTTELRAIKQADAQVLMCVLSSSAGIPFSTQWRQLQIPAAIAGAPSMANAKNFWQAVGDGKYMPMQSWICRIPMTDRTVKMWDDFKTANNGDVPQFDSVGCYDGTYIIVDAAKRAGTIETEAMIKALEQTNYDGVVGHYKLHPNTSDNPHGIINGPGGINAMYAQWIDENPDNWSVYWPNGKELHPAITAVSKITGWDKVKFPGTKEYQLPDWMVNYWKDKK